jgi:hypothetical protein
MFLKFKKVYKMKFDEKKTLTILLFASLTALLLTTTAIQSEEIFGTPSENSEISDSEVEEVEEEEVEEVEEEEVEEVEEEEVEEVEEEEVEEVEVEKQEKEESNESDYTNIAKEEDQEEEIDETREIDEDEESTGVNTAEPFKIYESEEVQPTQTINLPSFAIKKVEDKVIEKIEDTKSTGVNTPEPFKIYEKPHTKELKTITNSPFKINKVEDMESAGANTPKPFSPIDNYKEFKPLKLASPKTENKEESTTDVPHFGLFDSPVGVRSFESFNPIKDIGNAGQVIVDTGSEIAGDIVELGTGCRDSTCASNTRPAEIISEGGEIVGGGIGSLIPWTSNGGSFSGGSPTYSQNPSTVVQEQVIDPVQEQVIDPVQEQVIDPVQEQVIDPVVDEYNRAEENVKDEYNRAEENVKDEYNRAEENVKDEYNRAEENVKEEAQRAGDNIQDQFNQLFKFNIPIPFTIPGTALTGTVLLAGDYRYLQNTDFEITVAGFKPTDFPQIGSDYTIEQHFEATIEDIIRDLSGGTITQIDEGKQFISETLGIQIGPLATFKMDLAIKIPLPNSVSDLTSLKNLLKSINPVPSVVLTGCYNEISNNLPDVKQVNNVEDGMEQANEISGVIEDPNKAINQEEVCTTLITI